MCSKQCEIKNFYLLLICICIFTKVFLLDINHNGVERFEKLFGEKNIESSFLALVDQLELLWSNSFDKLKALCERTNLLPDGVKDTIGKLHSLREIITFLCRHHYCNWFEIRILRVMADVAGNSKANYLIESFSKHIYSRKVVEVEVYINPRFIGSRFSSVVKFKFNKLGKNISVGELLEDCQYIENQLPIAEGSIVPAVEIQSDRCVEVSLVLPLQYCHHAYNVFMKNFIKLRQFHVRYVQIESSQKVFAFKISTLSNLLERVSSSNALAGM